MSNAQRSFSQGKCYRVQRGIGGMAGMDDILLVKKVSEGPDTFTYEGTMMLAGETQSLVVDKFPKPECQDLIRLRYTVNDSSFHDCVKVSEELSSKDILSFMLEKQDAADALMRAKMDAASQMRVNCATFTQALRTAAVKAAA